MEKTAARPEAVKDAGRTRQSEIGYLLSEKKLLTAIGGFDPEYLNKELPKVEQRLRELGVKADEPEARREGGAGVQKETRLGEGGAAEARREAPAQEKPALPAIQEAKAEKEAEKVPLSWKDTFKSKFSASIRSFFDAIDVDTILWDARVEIQKKFKARQEALWGEEAVGGIIHSHSARGENYVGSDGAIPVEMIYRVVKAAGGGFVVLTDHDIFKPEDLSRLAEAADKSNKSQGAVSVFCGSEMTSGIEGEPGKLNKGHFVIWSIGKPLENDDLSDFLEPNITPSKMAEWAFKHGHAVLIPHPNSRRRDLRLLDISLEREDTIQILKLAEKYDKQVLIACRNGTTGDDYAERILGSRRHFWEFWRTPKLTDSDRRLVEKRGRFIVEADAHIASEFPQFVYFRKKEILGEDGRISQQKIYDALAEGRYENKWADEDFRAKQRLAIGINFFGEYARLIYVWLGKFSRGEVYQFNTAPRRDVAAEQKKIAAMPE